MHSLFPKEKGNTIDCAMKAVNTLMTAIYNGPQHAAHSTAKGLSFFLSRQETGTRQQQLLTSIETDILREEQVRRLVQLNKRMLTHYLYISGPISEENLILNYNQHNC